METRSNRYYQEKLEQGNAYQDFVCRELLHHGLIVQNTTSKQEQLQGENLQGWEIKLDLQMQQTGRIYIETHEKSHSGNIHYVPSGIYRQDNSWLFCIGDYRVLFVFGKKTLQRLDLNNPRWLYRPARTPTSQGFCLPVDRAEQIAERVIYFEQS